MPRQFCCAIDLALRAGANSFLNAVLSEGRVELYITLYEKLMDWNNEKVLEFIELIRSEPVIWDHKANSFPNRNETNKAWDRIQSQFSMQCPINELKRKRNSLMTAYRDYIRKIKETINNSANYDEIYKPTWFAFDAINSYMGSKYELNIENKVRKVLFSLAS